jgi:outer membrane protein OmpA-like peptidoglycan-associated protein
MKYWQALPFVTFALVMQAQQNQNGQPPTPLYRLVTVQDTAKAINYGKLKSAKIDFKGTSLLPDASGVAKVKCAPGSTRIVAKFKNLPAASSFGGEYLTYVMWGISTEGTSTNLGEIVLKHGEGELKATSQLAALGLVVTAEPYFAVSQPSNAVVLTNAARKDALGDVEYIDTKYELVQRGQYALDHDANAPMVMDAKTPFDVYQARNAVRIARAAGGEAYAQTAMNSAETYLNQSETKDGGKKARVMEARESVQSAEDARLIAVRRQAAEQVAMDKQLSQDRVDAANRQAASDSAAKDAALTEAARAGAAEAAANAQTGQVMANNDALRAQLLAEFNAVLQTRLTARGLIVNMSGVLFQTGKATLVPAAREKLAKIAGILASHKGLTVEADGFTDSTGSADFNMRLSGQRAGNARDYLVSQGVAVDGISSKGFGQADPVSSNDTSAGRQDNRRVELVISGDTITAPTTSQN